MQNANEAESQLGAMQGQSSDGSLNQQSMHSTSGLGKFNLDPAYHPQSLASAVAAAAVAAQQQPAPVQGLSVSHPELESEQRRSPAPMYPGASTIPTNFSSAQINSPEALQQFQAAFWKAHTASIEDNTPDFKTHLLPLARIKKVMKSDPDVKVQMISAEAPILFSKACEIFITEITQRAWMNAEENKRRTLQRQDVSFAAQRSEMFDFLIDVVPREEFANKKPQPTAIRDEAANPAAAGASIPSAAGAPHHQIQQQQQQPGQLPPPPPPPPQMPVQGGVVQTQQHPQHPSQQQQQQQQPSPHQQQHQPQPQQSPGTGLYNDPTFHQYYAQHFEAAGFPQATGPTQEQRQAYYQQIEREQLQWLQRQAAMGQFGNQRVISGSGDNADLSPQIQQQQIKSDMRDHDVKPDLGD